VREIRDVDAARATSVAHRKRRLWPSSGPSALAVALRESLDSAPRRALFRRNRATIVVSSRVLQKMIALSGFSATDLQQVPAAPMPLTM